MRFWIILGTITFLSLLLIGGHQTGYVPSISTITGGKKHEEPPPPPPPPPTLGPDGRPPKHAPVPEGYPFRDDNGNIIWDPPPMDALIHGTYASDGLARKPNYKLEPFPYSPMDNPPPHDPEQKPWIGAVICAAWDVQRRMLIRYSWMKMFKNVPMHQRFVVSNPGPQWTAIVAAENRTFGDMIVLDHIQEDDFTANTVKTIEFYRWLRDKSPVKYEFVSKMDTDLFVNARAYYDRKIAPRLDGNGTEHTLRANVNHTVIGQFYYDGMHHTTFPHGAIYTVTWDVIELLPTLQDKHHTIAGEDVTMAWLLMWGKQPLNFVVLSTEEKFEFDWKDTRPGEKTAWARKGTDLTSMWHAIYGPNVLAVHQLKKDDDWLRAASLFTPDGIIPMPTEPEKPPANGDEKPGYGRAYFMQIPPHYWETEADGSEICNGIWRLEPGVNRTTMERFENNLEAIGE